MWVSSALRLSHLVFLFSFFCPIDQLSLAKGLVKGNKLVYGDNLIKSQRATSKTQNICLITSGHSEMHALKNKINIKFIFLSLRCMQVYDLTLPNP